MRKRKKIDRWIRRMMVTTTAGIMVALAGKSSRRVQEPV